MTLANLHEKIAEKQTTAKTGLAAVEAEITELEANIETRLRDIDKLRGQLDEKKVQAERFKAQSTVLEDLGER